MEDIRVTRSYIEWLNNLYIGLNSQYRLYISGDMAFLTKYGLDTGRGLLLKEES